MIIPSYPTQPQWFNQFSRNRSPAAAPRAILLKSPASDQQIINFDTFYGEEPPAATAAASGALIDRTGVWVNSHQYSGPHQQLVPRGEQQSYLIIIWVLELFSDISRVCYILGASDRCIRFTSFTCLQLSRDANVGGERARCCLTCI